jgi:pimeloyl-ACP methyl ester carboxylesterase
MRISAIVFAVFVFSSTFVALPASMLAGAQSNSVVPQSIPAAIYTDAPADKAHPAAIKVLHIPTHGLLINGLIYTPAGAGPHPTLVICHGLPGNEKNLDLAQAVRRAGWNAVTFNYRGSWGSPGSFRFSQNIEDANAVLAYLRDPANASKLGIDPKRIAIAGHSMGGWVTAHVAAHDHALLGAILISAWDMGAEALSQSRPEVVAMMRDNMETLAGVTAESMADESITHANQYAFKGNVDGLADIPLLVLSANDGLAPETDALVKEITEKGSKKVTAIHIATDHGWSDHRIFLESTIINWLAALN